MIDVATGSQRLLVATPGGTWSAWSDDGRTLYWAATDSLQRFTIRGVPATGGVRKTLVYADAPERQVQRYGFAVAKGRFYFALVERKADVWVAEVEGK